MLCAALRCFAWCGVLRCGVLCCSVLHVVSHHRCNDFSDSTGNTPCLPIKVWVTHIHPYCLQLVPCPVSHKPKQLRGWDLDTKICQVPVEVVLQQRQLSALVDYAAAVEYFFGRFPGGNLLKCCCSVVHSTCTFMQIVAAEQQLIRSICRVVTYSIDSSKAVAVLFVHSTCTFMQYSAVKRWHFENFAGGHHLLKCC